MGAIGLAALISVVGLSVGPRDGALVWTGTPSTLGAPRFVQGASSPILSPNGQLVAYVVRGELRVQPVAGGTARTLTQLGGPQPAIAWSPSGAQIAFVAEGAIIQAPVVGKGPVRRISLPTSWSTSTFASLAWSTSGLAFSRTYGNGKAGTLKNELDFVDRAGAARTLYRNKTPYSAQVAPVFSPDGTQIVVQAGEGLGLVSVPTGQGRTVALTTAHEDSNPVWSPDGSWIAFQRSVPRGVSDVWLVHPDGTGVRKLTTTPIPPSGVAHTGSTPLAWSPDGGQLLCFRHDRFAVVTVATRASRDLKRTGEYVLFAARWL